MSAADTIRRRTRLGPSAVRPDIRLYQAHAGSRLSACPDAPPPYWAYVWAGGATLALHLAAHPACVAGRRVFDLGTGGGLVAIAAAKAGAAAVLAADIDPVAIAALRLNAAANGVAIDAITGDLLPGPPPAVDVVLAGDVFYEPALARAALAFLERCQAGGLTVLIGDPGRDFLPHDRLTLIATYAVPDFGTAERSGQVFGLRPP